MAGFVERLTGDEDRGAGGRVPPTARYPCAVFSAIEQLMKPIVFAPVVTVGVRVGVLVGPMGVLVRLDVARATS